MHKTEAKFDNDKEIAKRYEDAVLDILLEQGITKKNRKNYTIENIGDMEVNPERWRPCVDILERWEDDDGVHEIGHEVKAEITWTMNGGQQTYGGRHKEHQLELQPWTERKDEELNRGTGNLFIETRSLKSGKPGWYPQLVEALSDGLERYLWFVLVSHSQAVEDCKPTEDGKAGKIEWLEAIQRDDWNNNAILRIPARNFIKIVERWRPGHQPRPNREKSAEGYLMPLTPYLWRRPEKYEGEWTDGKGVKRKVLYVGLMSHPDTGSEARLYIDESRRTEIFTLPEKEGRRELLMV